MFGKRGIKRELFILFLISFTIFLVSGIDAAFVDNSSLQQIAYDCGILNTTNAVYTLNQSLNTINDCFNITASNITLNGNGFSIIGDYSDTDYGITAIGLTNVTLKNFNSISFFRYGIKFYKTNISIIENNTLSSNTVGIYVYNARNNLISNNYVHNSSSFSSTNGMGVYLYDAFNNTIENNIVEYNNYSLYLQTSGDLPLRCNYNLISNNTFSHNSIMGVNIVINTIGVQSENNTFINNNIFNNSGREITLRTGYSTNYLVYNNSFGEIKWTNNNFLRNITIDGDLTFPGNITISNNSAYFNPRGFTGNTINSSANITLYNIGDRGYIVPAIFKDGRRCTTCYNFTSLTADTIVFNVSSWSNYSINGLFAGGDGTAGNPYQISSWAQLDNIRTNLAANYILMANLSASSSDYIGMGDNWVPIGDCGLDNSCFFTADNNPFTGNFEGNNKTISNLTIKLSSVDYVGLFGVTTGNISNLGLLNVNITGSGYIGSLAGFTSGAIISNSYSTGNIIGDSYTGGLIGWFGGTMDNSYFTGNVNGSSGTGGLVGFQWGGNISNSYSTGNVFGSYWYVGGLVGGSGTIFNSYSTSNVFSSSNYVGGLVGWLGSGKISDSYSTGNVSGLDNVGGLVGWQTGGTIFNSSSRVNGTISGNDSIGVLVGYLNSSLIENSSSIAETSAILNGSSNVGFIGSNNGGNITDSYLTIRNTTFGNIIFLEMIMGGEGNMLENIIIGNNSVYVNSTQTGYNKSANITLYNIGERGFSHPVILKDGQNCTTCYNFTALNASTVIFNVSSWSNYSIGEPYVASSVVVDTGNPGSGRGGGGGGSSNQKMSLKIQVNSSIIVNVSGQVEIPFILENDGALSFYNINITAYAIKNNQILNNVKIILDKDYLSLLKINLTEKINLKTNFSNLDNSTYEILINVTSKNPYYNTYTFVSVSFAGKDAVGVVQTITFAEKFIQDNPECLELKAMLDEAQDKFKAGDPEGAIQQAKNVVEVCKKNIEGGRSFLNLNEIDPSWIYLGGLILVLVILWVIFEIYKFLRFGKFKRNSI